MPSIGTNGNDDLVGTSFSDSIGGLAGDDHLRGLSGDDILNGGLGADTLRGESDDDLLIGSLGDDTAFGAQGDDELRGGSGSDSLFGGNGKDRFVASSGDDAIYGGRGEDWVYGAPGDDSVWAGQDDDWVFGGAGDDDLSGQGGADKLFGGFGDDTLRGGLGSDTIKGGNGEDWLAGGSGDDVLQGDKGDDSFLGGLGDDLMIWNNGDGSDVMRGGKGEDRVQINLAGDAAPEGDEVKIGLDGDGSDLVFQRENLGLFQLDIGEVETVEINGQGGDDRIEVEADVKDKVQLKLDGGSDNNSDDFNPNNGDVLDLSDLEEGVFADLDINYAGVSNPGLSQEGKVVNVDNVPPFGGDETFKIELKDIENVIGTDFDDVLFGNFENNVIDGGGGNDFIHAFGGNDVYRGGSGIDTALFNEAMGPIDARLGFGIARTFLGDGIFDTNLLVEIENINGGKYDDLIQGDQGENKLAGLAGDDQVRGGAANDELFGGDGDDLLGGNREDDALFGGSGEDLMRGGDGDDTLQGDKQDDRFFGGSGNDLMIWNNGDGSDFMTGGSGEDKVQVNLADEGAPEGDLFFIDNNDGEVAFQRANLGLFQLDIKNTEELEVNGQAGDDTAYVGEGVEELVDLKIDGGSDQNLTELDPDSGDVINFVNFNEGLFVDLDVNFGDNGTPGLSEAGEAKNIAALPSQGDTETFLFTIDDVENVVGSDLGDVLIGNAESNVLNGAGGNDVLIGDFGQDLLIGGTGEDTFVFTGGQSGGATTIDDFSLDEDLIALVGPSFDVTADVNFRNLERDGDELDSGLIGLSEDDADSNVFVLQGAFSNAGAAADALANALVDAGADNAGDQSGFFIYFNDAQSRNRLIAVEDLDDVDSSLEQVANFGAVPDAASEEQARIFAQELLESFTEAQIVTIQAQDDIL